MPATADSDRLVFPTPTLVVGVGRVGLAVLERLGEDWHRLARAGVDPSLHNLRLVHVAEDGTAGAEEWRRRERRTAAVAAYSGDSDLPSLALDLGILRSLGLVRYHDGSYQAAVPRDAGVVETDVTEAAANRVDDGERKPHLKRRRYFAWLDLGPDPVVAAERLHRAAERDNAFDLFVTPILNRVRQGHSPHCVLSCVARAAALREGRDPSPWEWVGRLTRLAQVEDRGGDLEISIPASADEAAGTAEPAGSPGAAEGSDPGSRGREIRQLLGLDGAGLAAQEPLQGFAPAPLPGWDDWLAAQRGSDGGDRGGAGDRAGDRGPGAPPDLHLHVPPPFVPHASDTFSHLDPLQLLAVDWEATGWATDPSQGGRPQFHPVPASPFRLGLFDHDAGVTVPAGELRERLRHLGTLLHRGLVRFWLDLQRDRFEEREPLAGGRRRAHDEASRRQTLEILGELLVRNLFSGPGAGCPQPETSPYDALAERPSKFLDGILVEPPRRGGGALDALEERLAGLGLGRAEPVRRRRLLREVALAPAVDDRGSDGGGDDRDREAFTGLDRLRAILNAEVRQLFDVETLAAYRNWPTRRPPRLTVYLVGDVGEPFVRASFRTLLQEIHGELLRAFGPILEYFREGFERGLSVVPVIWMPHPADPFEGFGEGARCEEAAIINAVHGIRRWVESVIPGTRRRVAQIFVNSRVTDVAVLGIRDAVRQTRDFITFQVRNDLAQDEWLRKTTERPPGNDFFSSFTCYEIDFPAETAREYLANRLARDCIRRLKSRPAEGIPEAPAQLLEPPHLGEEVRLARSRLREATGDAADRIEGGIRGGAPPRRETPLDEIEGRFDDRFEDALLAQVQGEWHELSRERGGMDELTDRVRERASRLLSHRVTEVRDHGDRLIECHAAEGGVQTAIAGFREFGRVAREALEAQERERVARESVARRHSVPATSALPEARRRLLEAARARPEERPIRAGLALWLMLSPVLGAPLAQLAAYALDLHRRPGWIEPLLGPWAPLTGGALVFLAGWAAVRWFQSQRHRRLLEALADLARTGRRILEGTGREPAEEEAASVRSFLESRLLFAEALTTRGFTLHLFERVEGDRRLAERLNRSLDVQATLLAQGAEDLGVRPTLAAGPESTLADHPENDDLSHLFGSDGSAERLIPPERLTEVYLRWAGSGGDDLDRVVPRLLAEAGGFAFWRESACLSDGEALLAVGRGEFRVLVATPLPEQHRFAREVGERLCRFVARYYPNMGFGARFAGYEGLDPDGVSVCADAALVVHRDLEAIYQQAREQPGAPRTTATLRVVRAGVRRGSAYMLSLAQGIRAHSVRNLRRFESFHDRPQLPEGSAFPLSGEVQEHRLNLLSGYRDLGAALDARFRGTGGTTSGAGSDPG